MEDSLRIPPDEMNMNFSLRRVGVSTLQRHYPVSALRMIPEVRSFLDRRLRDLPEFEHVQQLSGYAILAILDTILVVDTTSRSFKYGGPDGANGFTPRIFPLLVQ